MNPRFELVYETVPGNGWLTKEEAEYLFEATSMYQGDILEVGCYQGKSTVLLASFDRPVHCVDPFSNFDSDDPTGSKTYQKFLQNLDSRQIKNVKIYKRKLCDAMFYLPSESIDFAYLDGDHTYDGTVEQLVSASLLGCKAVCVHDYATFGGGLNIKRAIQDTKAFRHIGTVGTMAYCEKL